MQPTRISANDGGLPYSVQSIYFKAFTGFGAAQVPGSTRLVFQIRLRGVEQAPILPETNGFCVMKGVREGTILGGRGGILFGGA